MSEVEGEPLAIQNYAGKVVVFSKITGHGVRIELKNRLTVIGPDEARRVGEWLLQSADEIEEGAA